MGYGRSLTHSAKSEGKCPIRSKIRIEWTLPSRRFHGEGGVVHCYIFPAYAKRHHRMDVRKAAAP